VRPQQILQGVHYRAPFFVDGTPHICQWTTASLLMDRRILAD